jgi:hypothetical protein
VEYCSYVVPIVACGQVVVHEVGNNMVWVFNLLAQSLTQFTNPISRQFVLQWASNDMMSPTYTLREALSRTSVIQ